MARLAAEAALAVLGLALVVCALAANQQWLDRHFVPSFFLPRLWYVRLETAARLLLAGVGGLLALVVRPRIGQLVVRGPARAVSTAVAAMLALAASEAVLRRDHVRPAEWLIPDEEPRRQPDPLLGWTFVPSRVGHATVAGRGVDYAFDSSSYRVRRVDEPVDVERPTILFTGESVMFGEGLLWEESVPAQVASMTGTQTANLAVHGFGTDQAFLRLRSDLPRFRQPVAVVSIFMAALFGRNLDDDRPHLGPGLVWLPGPAAPHWRLTSIAKLLVPYRADDTIERGIAVTREVLRATVELSRSRGATPIILVPQFGKEEDAERAIRRQVLDEPGIPYLWVVIDSAWRLPWDRHPNAQAARTIAAAVSARLRGH